MGSLVIIHFSPVELYPPVQNLLLELAKKNTKILLITTTNPGESLSVFKVDADRLKILRIGELNKEMTFLNRFFNYFFFYGTSLLLLIKKRPKNILYFETLSSYPACIYKKYLQRSVNLFAHYHEYTSTDQYQSGMKLENYFHHIERKLYNRFVWISHTNDYRMEKFKLDLFPTIINYSAVHILPNYPPRAWSTEPRVAIDFPIRVIYTGAFSLTTMYIREFAKWVLAQSGKVLWDIFSHNYSMEAKKYVQGLESDWINMYEGVDYNQLPAVLRKYDIGVVLYNGHIPNYVYNAPNKLFEYLACGLDVWFPHVMTGSLEFVKEDGIPKVLALDFSNLQNFNLTKAMDRNNRINDYSFFCEDALAPLINKLTNP
jgi:hypothetical protein